MALEVLQPLSTSEASGRGPPAVADQVPTTLDSWRRRLSPKSAEVLLQIAGANSGDLVRGRFSPYRCAAPPLPAKETDLIYGCTLVNHIYAEARRQSSHRTGR